MIFVDWISVVIIEMVKLFLLESLLETLLKNIITIVFYFLSNSSQTYLYFVPEIQYLFVTKHVFF